MRDIVPWPSPFSWHAEESALEDVSPEEAERRRKVVLAWLHPNALTEIPFLPVPPHETEEEVATWDRVFFENGARAFARPVNPCELTAAGLAPGAAAAVIVVQISSTERTRLMVGGGLTPETSRAKKISDPNHEGRH